MRSDGAVLQGLGRLAALGLLAAGGCVGGMRCERYSGERGRCERGRVQGKRCCRGWDV